MEALERLVQQITKVRDTGETNMFETNTVQHIANVMNCYDLVCYLAEKGNKLKYSKFIMSGDPTELI